MANADWFTFADEDKAGLTDDFIHDRDMDCDKNIW